MVGLFAAPLQNLVGLIDARIEQLGDGAEAPAASEQSTETSEAADEDDSDGPE